MAWGLGFCGSALRGPLAIKNTGNCRDGQQQGKASRVTARPKGALWVAQLVVFTAFFFQLKKNTTGYARPATCLLPLLAGTPLFLRVGRGGACAVAVGTGAALCGGLPGVGLLL